MGMTLNPYLNFLDNARSAMQFYAEVFGGELRMSTFGEYGMAQTPFANGIMHAQLETPAGFTLMASDTPPGMPVPEGSSITISLSGDDEPALRGYWDRLSEGGEVTVALERQMWGDTFGQCTDRFGTRWLVNIAGQHG